jgi:hypothetical protein
MSYALLIGLLSLGLCVGMLLLLEVGRRFAMAHTARNPGGPKATFGAVEGAVLGFLGLLLAFTINGAGQRFDHRRELVVEETNAIGTAYRRLDVLPQSVRLSVQENFRRYLDARIAMYRKLPDVSAARDDLARSLHLQDEIWRQTVAGIGAENTPPHAMVVLLPALNTMIDITTTRSMASQMHPPTVIFVMLYGLALASALLSGYSMGTARSWLHRLCFALIVSMSVYITLDLEYPRLGLLRVEAFDQAMVDLRNELAE